jgi:hypothetical protein
MKTGCSAEGASSRRIPPIPTAVNIAFTHHLVNYCELKTGETEMSNPIGTCSFWFARKGQKKLPKKMKNLKVMRSVKT